MFTLSCQTKLKSTVQATEAIVAEVQKMTQEEVTDEELALAKESYLNSFVFNFESKGQAVTRLMTYAYYGYPADFLQKIKANVEKVTKADVLRVAKSHLRPDKLQILIVGRPDDCDKPLSTLGEVKTLDITIPGSKK
jgi:predicted Zn-dependent peptidase